MCHTTLAQVVLESVIPSSRHAHVRLSLILFDFSFYFHPHFLVFFLSFLFMYSDDLDSVTNNLRDSAKGSNDGYDVAFSLTDVLDIRKYWPTACREAINVLLAISVSKGREKWALLTADVQAAFPEFQDKDRVLYCWPPKIGLALPGVQTGSLLLILKGVFGFHAAHVEWCDLPSWWWHVGNWRRTVRIKAERTRLTCWLRLDDETKVRSLREAARKTCQWRNHVSHGGVQGQSDSWAHETAGWRTLNDGMSWVWVTKELLCPFQFVVQVLQRLQGQARVRDQLNASEVIDEIKQHERQE